VRRTFLLAFAAFFLLGAAWAVALPVNGTYDEKHHIVRAYAVAHGDLLPAGPASDGTTFGSEGFDVPASLLPANVNCTHLDRGPASCLGPAGARSETVRQPSAAARYTPVYYLPVGLPLLVSPDRAGIVAARLVSALIAALLLAAAVVIGGSAGVALVATPMVMNLSGSLNPNGVEIAAGVLLFAALSALLRGGGAGPARGTAYGVHLGLPVSAGLAAFLLLTVRPPLGPVLLAVDVAACALLAGRGGLAALWRDRATRLILTGFALAGVAVTGIWTAVSGGPDTSAVPDRAVGGNILRQIAMDRWHFYVNQVVGQFGYGEVTISRYAIYLWYALWLVVLVPALIRAGWRLRLVLAGLAAFCLAVVVALDLHFAPLSGWFAHSRYVLPTAVGIVLLAVAYGRAPSGRWLPLALVAVTVPIHLYALARVLNRFRAGLDAPLAPFGGGWHPAGGPLLPLLLAVAGLAVLLGLSYTERDARGLRVTLAQEPDNGIVTSNGQSATVVTKASTTDAASH
jgi:hypothetical protein